MKFFAYIFGVIGAIIVGAIVFLLNYLLETDLHSLNVLFIIPVGGYLIGLVGVGGYYLSIKLSNSKMAKIDYFLVILLGLLTFFSINYISYKTIYLDANSSYSYHLSKPEDSDIVPLSDYYTFKNYIDIINSSSTYNLNRSSSGNGIELSETPTTILFYIQILGVILGSLSLAFGLSSTKYCDECKKYYKNKILKKFSADKFNTYAEAINSNLQNASALKRVIEQIENWNKKTKIYGQIELCYCSNCYDAFLVIKFFKVGINSTTEDVNMKKIIPLGNSVGSSFLE